MARPYQVTTAGEECLPTGLCGEVALDRHDHVGDVRVVGSLAYQLSNT